MSYFLAATIAKRTTLDKLNVKYRKLPQNLGITTEKISTLENYIEVYAAYFGGCGDQHARLYTEGKVTEEYDDIDDPGSGPINKALKWLGVIKDNGKDEFDTINLCQERDNDWL